MKKELKRKYLPFNYRQDIYLKTQNFKQRYLSVEEYSAKFVNLIIEGDLQEAEEICIAHHYTACLRSSIARVIFLQPYNSLQDVMKLALKVGTKKKYGNSTTTKSVANEGFVEGSCSWNPSGMKTTPTQVKSEAQQVKTCFKRQGLGHIDSECPNQKAFALIEEDEAKEEIPHRELGWPKALPHKGGGPRFESPGGILGSILTRPVLRGPQGIMGMRKRTDHPWVIKKKKKKRSQGRRC